MQGPQSTGLRQVIVQRSPPPKLRHGSILTVTRGSHRSERKGLARNHAHLIGAQIRGLWNLQGFYRTYMLAIIAWLASDSSVAALVQPQNRMVIYSTE